MAETKIETPSPHIKDSSRNKLKAIILDRDDPDWEKIINLIESAGFSEEEVESLKLFDEGDIQQAIEMIRLKSELANKFAIAIIELFLVLAPGPMTQEQREWLRSQAVDKIPAEIRKLLRPRDDR